MTPWPWCVGVLAPSGAAVVAAPAERREHSNRVCLVQLAEPPALAYDGIAGLPSPTFVRMDP